MSENDESSMGTPQCKNCKEPIEGDVILLHGRFPMHGDCYEQVIRS